MNQALAPQDLTRRSNLWRSCAARDATWIEVNGFACPLSYGDPDKERAAATTLGMADATALPRSGYKGWGMANWVSGHTLVLCEPNGAQLQSDGTLACRLSAGELLLLASDHGASEVIGKLADMWSMDGAECYPVPREDTNARLVLTGSNVPEMMAKVCGVDLRPGRFANHAIAQTSVARQNAVVVRNDRGSCYALDILFDSAAAVYMWDCLVDAMAEFDGAVIGLAALRELADQ